MDLEDIYREDEQDFKNAVAHDVAEAVGGDASKVRVLALERGSIRVHTALDPGVCGDQDPLKVARDLAQQASDPKSALKNGLFTSAATGATVSISKVPAARSAAAAAPASSALRAPLSAALSSLACKNRGQARAAEGGVVVLREGAGVVLREGVVHSGAVHSVHSVLQRRAPAAPSSAVLSVPEYEYNHLVVVADGEGKEEREEMGGRFLMEEGVREGSESEEADEGEEGKEDGKEGDKKDEDLNDTKQGWGGEEGGEEEEEEGWEDEDEEEGEMTSGELMAVLRAREEVSLSLSLSLCLSFSFSRVCVRVGSNRQAR
jgi:hypothetical protein